MADEFGGLLIPAVPVDVTADDGDAPPGDPTVHRVGLYLQAVLNATLNDAWVATIPSGTDPNPIRTPIVKTVRWHDPEKYGFNDTDIPCLFVWRKEGKTEWLAEAWTMSNDTIMALWIGPGDAAEIRRNRAPLGNAIAKTAEHWLELDRHPSWVDTGDPDPMAPSIAASANSFLLSKATSLSPLSYSGASLDGAIGTSLMSPRLEPTISTTVAAGAYSTSAPIVFTYLNWYNIQVTASITLTQTNGGETIGLGEDVQRVVQVDVPAQLTTTGHITVGNSARAGRGSMLLMTTSATRIDMASWQTRILSVERLEGNQRIVVRGNYTGVELTIDCRERRKENPDTSGRSFPQTQIDYSLVRSDKSVIEPAHQPDGSQS